MDIMPHAKFHFNRLMLTLIFGIRASEPPPPRTEKAGPDRVKSVLTRLVGNKASRRYGLVNTQTDKNLASDEYFNIESEYYRKILMHI